MAASPAELILRLPPFPDANSINADQQQPPPPPPVSIMSPTSVSLSFSNTKGRQSLNGDQQGKAAAAKVAALEKAKLRNQQQQHHSAEMGVQANEYDGDDDSGGLAPVSSASEFVAHGGGGDDNINDLRRIGSSNRFLSVRDNRASSFGVSGSGRFARSSSRSASSMSAKTLQMARKRAVIRSMDEEGKLEEANTEQLAELPASLYIFDGQNPFRVFMIQVMQNWWFQQFILFCIIFNAVLLGVDQPATQWSSQVAQFLRISDFVFTGVFILEAFIKIVALGLVLHEGAYLRSGWGVLDAVIVVSSVVNIALEESSGDGSNLSALRVVRVLRPLRSVSQIPELRILIQSLLRALPEVADNILLFFFLLVIFAMTGLQIWGGNLSHVCWANFDNNSIFYPDTRGNLTRVFPNRRCGGTFDCRPGTIPNVTAAGVRCEVHEDLFNPVFRNFNNIAVSALLVFKIMVLDNWIDDFNHLMDAVGAEAIVYVVVVVLMGFYCACNLFFAVLANAYSSSAQSGGNSMEDAVVDATFKDAQTWIDVTALEPLILSAVEQAERDRVRMEERKAQREKDDGICGPCSTCCCEDENDRSGADTNNSKNNNNNDKKETDESPFSSNKSSPRNSGQQSTSSPKNVSNINNNNSNNGLHPLITTRDRNNSNSSTTSNDQEEKSNTNTSATAAQKSNNDDEKQQEGNDNEQQDDEMPALTIVSNISSAAMEMSDAAFGVVDNIPVDLTVELVQEWVTNVVRAQREEFNRIRVEEAEEKAAHEGLCMLPLSFRSGQDDDRHIIRCVIGWIVGHRLTELFMLCVTLLNTVALALDHYNIEESFLHSLDVISTVCTAFFTLEITLKIIAFGPGTLLQAFNFLDFFIVLESLIQYMINGTIATSGLAALRVLRTLRVLKLLTMFPSLQLIVRGVLHSMGSIGYLSLLIVLHLFVFAVMGMQIFGTDFINKNPDEELGFGSTYESFLIAFIVLTGDSWTDRLKSGMLTLSSELQWIAVVYFVLLFFIGNFVLVNLMVAIILDHMQQLMDSIAEGRGDRFPPVLTLPPGFIIPQPRSFVPKFLKKSIWEALTVKKEGGVGIKQVDGFNLVEQQQQQQDSNNRVHNPLGATAATAVAANKFRRGSHPAQHDVDDNNGNGSNGANNNNNNNNSLDDLNNLNNNSNSAGSQNSGPFSRNNNNNDGHDNYSGNLSAQASRGDLALLAEGEDGEMQQPQQQPQQQQRQRLVTISDVEGEQDIMNSGTSQEFSGKLRGQPNSPSNNGNLGNNNNSAGSSPKTAQELLAKKKGMMLNLNSASRFDDHEMTDTDFYDKMAINLCERFVSLIGRLFELERFKASSEPSLYIFAIDNPIRRCCLWLHALPLYNLFVFFAVVINVVFLFLDNPSIGDSLSQLINIADVFVAVVFCIDLCSKIIAFGFLWPDAFTVATENQHNGADAEESDVDMCARLKIQNELAQLETKRRKESPELARGVDAATKEAEKQAQEKRDLLIKELEVRVALGLNAAGTDLGTAIREVSAEQSIGAFLRDPWNVVDGIVTIVSLVTIAGAEDAKFLRSLRTFRLLSRLDGPRIILESIFASMPMVLNGLMLSMLAFTMFGVLGVQLFKGAMYRCSDPSVKNKANCTGLFYDASVEDLSTGLRTRRNSSVAVQRRWEPTQYNFDSFPEALLSLFVIVAGDSWANVLYNGMAIVGVDEAMEKHASPQNALFFVAAYVVGNIFCLNMIVGILLNFFQKEKDIHDGSAFLSERQKKFLRARLSIEQTWLPPDDDRLRPNDNGCSRFMHRVLTMMWWELKQCCCGTPEENETSATSASAAPAGEKAEAEAEADEGSVASNDGINNSNSNNAAPAAAAAAAAAATAAQHSPRAEAVVPDPFGAFGVEMREKARDDDDNDREKSSSGSINHDKKKKKKSSTKMASGSGWRGASSSPSTQGIASPSSGHHSPGSWSSSPNVNSSHIIDHSAEDYSMVNDLAELDPAVPAGTGEEIKDALEREEKRVKVLSVDDIGGAESDTEDDNNAPTHIETTIAQTFFYVVILLNLIVNAIEYQGMPHNDRLTLEYIEIGCLVVFTVELVMKICAYGLQLLNASFTVFGWFCFDSLIIITGFVALNNSDLRFLSFLRALRLIKLFRGTGVEKLLLMLVRSFQQIINVFIVLMLSYFIFACAGVALFGRAEYNPNSFMINNNRNFHTVHGAMLLLFQSSTTDGWGDFASDVSNPRYCNATKPGSCVSRSLAHGFFVIFMCSLTWIGLQMFIAILIESFDNFRAADAETDDPVRKAFEDLRKNYDAAFGDGAPDVNVHDFVDHIHEMPMLLTQFTSADPSPMERLRLLGTLPIPIKSDMTISFRDVVLSFSFKHFQIDARSSSDFLTDVVRGAAFGIAFSAFQAHAVRIITEQWRKRKEVAIAHGRERRRSLELAEHGAAAAVAPHPPPAAGVA